VHRAYNTDDPARLSAILVALGELGSTVVLPLHPRTRQRLAADGGDAGAMPANLRLVDPLSYLDMLRLLDGSELILTDSGGVQKEAYWLGIPCITLRPETEWVETVDAGWNVIVDADPARIAAAAGKDDWPRADAREAFGRGDAGARIVDLLDGGSEGAG
jgi:UDP-N-acetylglucosamine 2-epimerase